MPFRHVAMFRWAEHVDAGHVQRVRDAYDELAARASGIRHHAHGADVGVSEGTFDYLVVADFDSPADWRAYRDHPTHVLLIEELIAGYVIDRAIGQFQMPDERTPTDETRDDETGDDETDDDETDDETDDELLARARRAAMAAMQALLSESDDLD